MGANWKAGQEGFQPPPDWNSGFEFHGGGFTSDQSKSADYSDFFEQLFGRGAGGFSSGTGGSESDFPQGENSHAKVFIDIEDVYIGASRSLTLRSTVLGEGGRPQIKERILNVKIPQGVKEGQSIRLKGQGSPGLVGGQPGDLYLEIRFNPHSIYRIDGSDVSLDLPIMPWEAALGNKIQIPTPGGKVDLKIPPGSSSGKRMRLKGRGIPGKTPGDFYVTLEIILPDKLSDKEKALYKTLQQETSSFNPRAKLGV